MAKNSFSDKRCPRCGGRVDIADTCRSCGRSWSESLDEGEIAIGLDEGQEYESTAKEPSPKKPRRSRYAKTKKDLPPEFDQWDIKIGDDDTEIIRKRSLMRLDSRRTYSAMGIAVRAQETQKAAFIWLARLQEFLDEEEQRALAPTLGQLKAAYELLTMVRTAKVAQAVRMEKALEKAHQTARMVRLAAAEPKSIKVARVILPGQDTEGLGLMPVAIDPALLLQQTEEKLLAIEMAKTKAKNQQREKAKNPFDSE